MFHMLYKVLKYLFIAALHPKSQVVIVIFLHVVHCINLHMLNYSVWIGMWCLQLYNSAALCHSNPNHPPLKTHFSLCLSAECKFHCTNGRCLKLLSLICNHLNECGDNSDEEHCPAAVPPPPDTIQCKSIRPSLSQCHICISYRWYCISVGEATVENDLATVKLPLRKSITKCCCIHRRDLGHLVSLNSIIIRLCGSLKKISIYVA